MGLTDKVKLTQLCKYLYNLISQDEKTWKPLCTTALNDITSLRKAVRTMDLDYVPRQNRPRVVEFQPPELQKPDNFNWKQYAGFLREEATTRKNQKKHADSQYAYIPCGMMSSDETALRPDTGEKSCKVKGWCDHPDAQYVAPIAPFRVTTFEYAVRELYRFEKLLSTISFVPSSVSGAMARYHQFMQLKVKYPKMMLVPTVDIEMIWMSHLIRPKKYKQYCLKNLKAAAVIPHFLYAGDDYVAMKEGAFKSTAALWKQEYNQPYWISPKISEDKNAYSYDNMFNETTYTRKHGTYASISEDETKKLPSFIVNWKGGSISDINMSVEEVLLDRNWFSYLTKFVSCQYSVYQKPKLFSLPMCRYIVKSYERFLYLNCKYPSDSLIHPTYVIDLAWHAHMAHPVEYEQDMKDLMGKYIDHEPWPKVPEESMKKVYNETCSQWKKEYGVEMEKDHWYFVSGVPMFELDKE